MKKLREMLRGTNVKKYRSSKEAKINQMLVDLGYNCTLLEFVEKAASTGVPTENGKVFKMTEVTANLWRNKLIPDDERPVEVLQELINGRFTARRDDLALYDELNSVCKTLGLDRDAMLDEIETNGEFELFHHYIDHRIHTQYHNHATMLKEIVGRIESTNQRALYVKSIDFESLGLGFSKRKYEKENLPKDLIYGDTRNIKTGSVVYCDNGYVYYF